MKKHFRILKLLILALGVVGSSGVVLGFPPAPPAVVHGIVRDELGNPIAGGGGSVVCDPGTGVTASTIITLQGATDENYSLMVSMDSGVTSDLYKPTALVPASPFRLKVQIGNTTYVPIQMQGNLATLGAPGSSTRLDLTLGVSSANDGLPDAWKRSIIQQLGLGLNIGQIHPGDIAPGTGMTYYQIYVAGTYTLSPTNGFALKIEGHDEASSNFSFTAVKGRSYTVQAGSDLGQLSAVAFQVTANGVAGQFVNSLVATNTSLVRIVVPNNATADTSKQFFRLSVE